MHNPRTPLIRSALFLLVGLAATLCFSLASNWIGFRPVTVCASGQAREAVSEQPAQPAPEQLPTQQPGQEAKPALFVAGRFTGVNEPEGIKLVAESSSFAHSLQIAAIANKEIKDLRVDVAPFTGPNSIQRNVVWKINNQAADKLVTVPGLGSIPLELSADLPIAGNYESTIWLIYEQRRWPIKLTVTRTRTAPSVEVLGVETARDSAFLPSENASVWFTLHEKAGKRVALNMPTLTSLALIQSDKSKLQAKYDSIKVSCLGEDCKTEGGFLILAPGQTVHIQLTIVGLRDSGEFSGNVRVSGPDGDPIDQAVTILRKKSGWLAGLLIALGVAIYFALRHYASSVRPRLIRQREVLGLKQDIDELKRTSKDLDQEEQEVLAHLQNQARDLDEDIATVRESNPEQRIKDIKAKVDIFPRWAQERDRVESLQPPELQEEFKETLRKIKSFMYTSPITDAVLAETRTTLDDIAPRMKAKVKEDSLSKALKDPELDLIYFYCHAGGGRNDPTGYDPHLLFQDENETRPEKMRVPDFPQAPEWSHHPLVFLNGCGTLGFSPDALSPFIQKLVEDLGAGGVIGTEVTVWEELAIEVAQLFLEKFLHPKCAGAGDALLDVRRSLLAKKNPLGLVYTLYAPAHLQLRKNE